MSNTSRPLNHKGSVSSQSLEHGLDERARERWILVATIVGSSLVFIDANVVNVALPQIQADLSADVSGVQWVVEAYSLFLASLMLVGGSLGDRFGLKRIFAIGIALFAAASMWCGLAPNATQLIVARAVQGIGGALLTPGSLAIIRATFSAARRGRAIGLWSGFSAITSALGPLLGGWLVQHVSWRWVFFIDVPLALVVLAVLFLPLRHLSTVAVNESGVARGLDLPGALLATLGLGGLVFGLVESNTLGLSNRFVLLAIGVGLLALIAFVFVEVRSASPMMPLKLFRSPTFSGTNLLTLFLYAALSGSLFFLPFDLIQAQGYSATAAGASLLPFTLLMFALSRWSGGLVNRFGAKLPLIVGPLVAAAGFALFALPGVGGSYWTTFFPAVMVLGLGMSITVAPLTTAVLGAVSDRYAGIASGINNAVSRLGGLLAIAILSIFVLNVFTASLNSRLASLPVSASVRQAILAQSNRLAGVQIPPGIPPALRHSLEQAVAASFVSGFRVAMLIGCGLALAAALSALLLVEGKPPRSRRQQQ